MRICEWRECDKVLVRRVRADGFQEFIAAFKRRKTCSRSCANKIGAERQKIKAEQLKAERERLSTILVSAFKVFLYENKPTRCSYE